MAPKLAIHHAMLGEEKCTKFTNFGGGRNHFQKFSRRSTHVQEIDIMSAIVTPYLKADLDEHRISTMTRTTTCRSGGFAPAVAPLRKFIVIIISVHLLGPSVRQHSLRTCRTPTYEMYDHPYVKLDVVRVVRRTTSRCFAYGPS